MYARILLCSGYKTPLWYKIPPSLVAQAGSLVQVPLRTQKVTGFVLYITASPPLDSGNIRDIIALEKIPQDAIYLPFIGQLGTMYQTDPTIFIKRIQHFLYEKEHDESLFIEQHTPSIQIPLLTKQQETVVSFVNPLIIKGHYIPTLVHGVTGSGKTEIINNAY
jgi:primosomal protein N'